MKKPLNIIIILAISFAIISISLSASHVAGSTPESCFFGDNANYVEDLQNTNTTSMLPGYPTSLTLTYCGDDKMCYYKGNCVAKGCYDADNNAGRGESFYIKGYAAYKKSIKTGYYGHAIDKCSGKTLYEGICTSDGKAQYITHTCPLGCTNNACEKECKPLRNSLGDIIGRQDYNPQTGKWTAHRNGCSGNNVVTWSCHYSSTLGRYTAYISSSTACLHGCSQEGCNQVCAADCLSTYSKNQRYPDYIFHSIYYNDKEYYRSFCFLPSQKSNVCKGDSLIKYYCDGTGHDSITVDCQNGCTSIFWDWYRGDMGFCNPHCQDIISDKSRYWWPGWWDHDEGIGVIIHDGKKDAETHYDYCIDKNTYKRYYCSGDPPSTKMNIETVKCKQGYYCSNGECVTDNPSPHPPPPTNSYTCTKSDEYKNNPTRPNPGKAGITQLKKNGRIKETEKDSCNKNILTEYYCSANSKLDSIPYEKIDCSTYYSNGNGICQTGSDGGYCSGS